MKFDYISYYSTQSFVGISDLKEKLPVSIQKELLQGEKFKHGIYVEISATDIIEEIDKIFKIGKKMEVAKFRQLEIDELEIPDIAYFQINPKGLEHGRQVLFDLDRPKCKSESCPWGSGISSPITIKQKSLKNLGIAQIDRLWGDRPELIVSTEVKTLFESEGITGLKYEPCISGGEDISGISEKADAYLATILPKTYHLADDIILKTYCKKHKIILNYEVFNTRFSKEAIINSDFQLIKELRVGRKTYIYYIGQWVISQKVLNLLLKHKVPGLKPYGYVLGQKFLPIIIY
jgi:hypothetical protein